MSEFRQDIFSGDWVIFASNRSNRPHDFIKKITLNDNPPPCPFCYSGEEKTPNVIYQNGESGQWSIRVFPNMYPAVTDNGEAYCENEQFYKSCEGYGFHEVVVDTPEHDGKLHDFSEKHISDILLCLKERVSDLKSRKNIKYVQIFKNSGPDAGASLSHSHWQIMAVPVLPAAQMKMKKAFDNYYKSNQKCIMCDIIKYENEKSVRVAYENKHFIAFCPYASKMCYEIYIAPKEHITSFSDVENIDELSEILKKTLLSISQIYKGISYNICFQDTATDSEPSDIHHWFIRVIPRMGNPAGFEYATGGYINPIYPEEAALYYRTGKKPI